MKHAAILLAFLGLLALLIRGRAASGPYEYDEADYMYAASLGLAANYTDSPTMPIADFLRTGFSRGKDASQRTALSEQIRHSGDVVFYRHWHGPFYYYGLAAASNLRLSENSLRTLQYCIPVLSLFAIYFGALSLLPGGQGFVAATLSSALFLWSPPVLLSSELAPHQLFALLFTCSLFLAAKVMESGKRTFWYAAVVVAGLAFCTLELSFVLLLTLACCAYLERERLRLDWRLAARSLLIFATTVLVIWPAAILKLSFIKAYFFMAYLALMRKSPWGNEGFLETWSERFINAPVQWALLMVGAVLFVRYRGLKGRRLAYPFALYGLLATVAALRITTGSPRYQLVFEPALDLAAGLMVALWLMSLRPVVANGVLAALCVGLFCSAQHQIAMHPRVPNPRPATVIAQIAQHHLQNKTLLVPQGDLPMIHYYFPETRLRGYYEDSPAASEAAGFMPDATLYPGYPVQMVSRGATTIE
ncbi:MAG TPA: hypothetical protein VEU96_22635 [Bryobacteraceae bacterium]|nr:hypothetical protein [Bryobacteraceae bacterium]